MMSWQGHGRNWPWPVLRW